MDISDAMLSEARRNCDSRLVSNVRLLKSDDNLSQLSGKYDLIHSFIVFQHIPVKRGQQIFENLLEHLADNGICVAQFTYARDMKINHLISSAKQYIPWLGNCINLIKGRGFFAPQMQMNCYDINRLLQTIQKANAVNCFSEFTKHDGELGITLYFRKPAPACVSVSHAACPAARPGPATP